MLNTMGFMPYSLLQDSLLSDPGKKIQVNFAIFVYMSNFWQIWIDTGGTFTDCMARRPAGDLLRTKVLSSSRLRATILGRKAANTFVIRHNWTVQKDIFANYTLLKPGTEAQSWKVLSLDPLENILQLDRDIESDHFPLDFEITAYEEAPILATRLLTHTPLDQALPPLELRLGSTKGTNALLERKGCQLSLLITQGFADLPFIGSQDRPHLFQLDIPDPELLHQDVIEVKERTLADGSIEQALSEAEIARILAELDRQGPDAVAIALLHSYQNPTHEQRLARAIRDRGHRFVSVSSQLSPTIKLLFRAQTALVDASLSPILYHYLSRIADQLPATADFKVMTSAGGLSPVGQFAAKDSLLSGPAGGVVGAANITRRLGVPKVLTLDMGGTSTDTARYAGSYDYRYLTQVGAIGLHSPSLDVETVAAGGGSICGFDGIRLFVGPDSAGAQPGPACYGAGGPLTITDVNLLLDKLDPSIFPIPLDREAAQLALDKLCSQINQQSSTSYTAEELLRGFESMANEKMAGAIRRISIQKGFDPREYALLVFGGAGGLHACALADLLDIDRVILPSDGGILSAYGMGQARLERLEVRQVLALLDNCMGQLPTWIDELEQLAIERLGEDGIDSKHLQIDQLLLYLRFKGQDSSVEVVWKEVADLRAGAVSSHQIKSLFQEAYRQLFGHWPLTGAIELESIKLLVGQQTDNPTPSSDDAPQHFPQPYKQLLATLGPATSIAVYQWEELSPGACLNGPAIVLNKTSTAYIEPDWQLRLHQSGDASLYRTAENRPKEGQHKGAIELELFTHRFEAIAKEMGARLQRTAFSVNIKERLDFSCALLDASAELLVNAPHIPVHLGSLGICARLVLEKLSLVEGDVIITNHPKYGGSHLPDVTLLAGAFDSSGQLIGYVINRAHHAEIGGKRPGSMPPDARSLAEEGVVIAPTYLMRGGELQWSVIESLLREHAHPSRSPEENVSDAKAALASLHAGQSALRRLCDQYGRETVHHYMKALKERAAGYLGRALQAYEGKTLVAEESLDDGHKICLRIQCREGQLSFDFAGSSSVHPFNLNANISIVYSAIIYVLRLLCQEEMPLNEGLVQKVRVNLPENGFLHPQFSDDPWECPAVVGGNTEVSQRLVDALLKAFGLAACSQGTMNNFLFGNQNFGYYETIGGGAGAGPGFHGRSGVHQHMTNTRITDPEELEFRYPVLLRRFALRRGSGGAGQWRGGDGLIRELEFCEAVDVTLIGQHRKQAPYGREGGHPGQTGRQYLIRKEGEREELEGIDSRRLEAGDRIVIETPGGGGWERPKENGPE